MINQNVICPDCGKEIPFDAWDDVFDTSADTAKICYTVKFNKISY